MEPVLEGVRPARPGVTHPAQREGRTGFLSDVLVELGYIDAQTAEWAVEQGRVEGQAVPQVLLEAGLLNEDRLSRATAELHGLDHVDLGEFDVDLEVARLITKPAARRYGAVPIAFDDDGTLLIALSDPVDPLAVDDIAVMTKSEVRPMVAGESSIDAVVEQLHDPPTLQPRLEEPPIEPLIGRHREETQSLAPAAYQSASPQPQPAALMPDPPANGPRPPLAEPRPPAPGPVADGETAQMRQALADLAARVESFTVPPPEPARPSETTQPSVSVEEHEGALSRLATAERRASEEGLRHHQAERQLRAELESAKEATRRLEQRLSSVLAVAAEIRAACEKLVDPGQQG